MKKIILLSFFSLVALFAVAQNNTMPASLLKLLTVGNVINRCYVDEINEDEIVEESYFPTISTDEIEGELELTSKVSLESIKDEIKNTVSNDFDYYKYSDRDGSNTRFMEKQKNTNAFRDTIFDTLEEVDNETKTENNSDIETLF